MNNNFNNNSERVSIHSNHANQAISKGKYHDALGCYRQALAEYLRGSPTLVELVNAAATCFNLGALSKKIQDYKQAGNYFRQAETLYRTCAVQAKQLPAATTSCSKQHYPQQSATAATAQPYNCDVCLPQLIVETLQARAHLHYKYQKWLDDAIECHELVVEVLESEDSTSSSSPSANEKPVIYSKIQFTILEEESRQDLLVASLQSLGKFYVERGDLEDGLMAYQETLRVLKTQQEMLGGSGSGTQQRQDEISQIIRALTEIYRKSKPVETEVPQLQLEALQEEELGNWDTALSYWERILFLQSQNFGEDSVEVARTLFQLARVMILEENHEGGLDLYHAAIAKYLTTQTPIPNDLISNAVEVYCHIGQQSEAISWMNDMLEQVPTPEESATIHFELGKLYLANGELAQASDALCKSAECCGDGVNDEHVFKLLQKVEFLQQRTDVKNSSSTMSGVVGGLNPIIEDDECSATIEGEEEQEAPSLSIVQQPPLEKETKRGEDQPPSNIDHVDQPISSTLPSIVSEESEEFSGDLNDKEKVAEEPLLQEEEKEDADTLKQDPEERLRSETPVSPRHVADETVGDSCGDVEATACSSPRVSSPFMIPEPTNEDGMGADDLSSGKDVAGEVSDDDRSGSSSSRNSLPVSSNENEDDHPGNLSLSASALSDGEAPFDEEVTPETIRAVTPGALSTISSPVHEYSDGTLKQHNETTSKAATEATEPSLGSCSPGRSPSVEEEAPAAFEGPDEHHEHAVLEKPLTALNDRIDLDSELIDHEEIDSIDVDSNLMQLSDSNDDDDDDDVVSHRAILKSAELPRLDQVEDASNPVEIGYRQSPIAEDIAEINAQNTEETPDQPILSIVPTSSSSPVVSETSRTGLLQSEEKPTVNSKIRLPALPASPPKHSKTRNRREYSEVGQASRSQSRSRFVKALSSPFRRSKTKKEATELRAVNNEAATAKQNQARHASPPIPKIDPNDIEIPVPTRTFDPARNVPISMISLRNNSCDDDDQSLVSQITFRMDDQPSKPSQHDSQWWWGVTAEGLEGWFPTSYVHQAVEAAEEFLYATSIHDRVKSRPLDFDSDDESEVEEEESSPPLEKSEEVGVLRKPSNFERKNSAASSGLRPSIPGSSAAIAPSQSAGSRPQSLNVQIQEKLEILDRARSENAANSTVLDKTLFELAVLYYKQGNAVRAMDYAQRALKAQKGNNKLPEACKTLHVMADIHSRQHQYKAALSCYSETQRIHEALFGYFHEETASTLNRIGNVLARKGEFDLAMENHKEALRILKECFGEEIKNPLVSQTLIQIGAVYYKERNSLATIQSKVDGYTTFIEGGMLEVIGRAHEERGSYKMAIAFFEEKLQFLNDKTQTNDLEQVAETLNSLGMLSCRAGMYLEAIDYYDRALAIQMELGCDEIQLSMARVLAGSVQYALGHFDKAMKLFEDAISTLRQEIGSEQETIAATLFHMGVVRVSLYDYDAAMTDLKEAYSTQSKLLGNDHPATLRTRREIANLYAVYVTEANSAFQEYNSIIATQIRIHGEKHPNVAETLHYIGCAYAQTGDYSTALKSLEDCYNTRLEFLGSDHPSQATTLHEIAKIQLKRGRIKKALHICESALTIRIDALGEHHVDVANTTCTKASCLVARGSFNEASKLFIESLKIAEAAVGPSHPSVASIHGQIGIMHLRKCHFEEASEEIQKALDIYRTSNLDEDHPGIKEALQDLERVERAEMLCV